MIKVGLLAQPERDVLLWLITHQTYWSAAQHSSDVITENVRTKNAGRDSNLARSEHKTIRCPAQFCLGQVKFRQFNAVSSLTIYSSTQLPFSTPIHPTLFLCPPTAHLPMCLYVSTLLSVWVHSFARPSMYPPIPLCLRSRLSAYLPTYLLTHLVLHLCILIIFHYFSYNQRP